ncbi:MAG: N-acetylmuramoyl-L-alanine amidase family protein, partial [bacterium]
MKKTVFLPMLIMLAVSASAVTGSELVNLKFFEIENKASVSCDWITGRITIEKNGIKAKIYLNYPYVLGMREHIRIDESPFANGENIFVSKYTYDTVLDIVKGKRRGAGNIAAPEKEKEEKKRTAEKKKKQAVSAEKKPEPAPAKEPDAVRTETRRKNNKRIIVLDPGHGGKDPGAVGAGGLLEKDVVLGIALRAKWYLDKYPGVKVYITRSKDRFISLKKRAVFANEKKADLFVSIHCNASPSRQARGTRTYIFSRIASSKEAAAAAKLENKEVGMVEFLLNDLKKGATEYLSIEAAGYIQHRLVQRLGLRWSPTERAPFYV